MEINKIKLDSKSIEDFKKERDLTFEWKELDGYMCKGYIYKNTYYYYEAGVIPTVGDSSKKKDELVFNNKGEIDLKATAERSRLQETDELPVISMKK